MDTYIIEMPEEGKMVVKFGVESNNDQKVIDAEAQLDALDKEGRLKGELLTINGPASLPVAMTIAHKVAHRFGAIACFDPKVNVYVVCIAHGGKYALGQTIPV